MPLVRVPVAGTIGKAVRLNPDATVGAQIATDLALPDGTIPSMAELADALYLASPPTFVTPNSSGSVGPVFETDIIDGALLARVADAETISGLWDFTAGLTFDGSNGLKAVTGQSGTVQTFGPGTNGDTGYSIDGKFALVLNSVGGFVSMWDDVNNLTLWKAFPGPTSSRFEAFFDGNLKFTTLSNGIRAIETIDAVTISHLSQGASTPVKQLVSKQRVETITAQWNFAKITFDTVLEDKISLWGNLLGATNMIGFGTEANTLYFKAPTNHRWYIGVNADGGTSDKMQLDATVLTLAVGVTISGTDRPGFRNVAGTITVPTVCPNILDTDTGHSGEGATNALSSIVGGKRAVRYRHTGAGDGSLETTYDLITGIGASTTQTQGQATQNSAEYSEITIVANANDVITLGAAVAGRKVTYVNSGAQTLQIFPLSGDNLGKGLNTSITVKAGRAITLFGLDSTNWQILEYGGIFGENLLDGTANETITGAWNFAAITATSYDGILAANLLDKTAFEIVTGRWDFESDGSAPQLCIVDSDSNGAATRAFIEFLGKGDVLTGRMGYLSAASGIFTIDNALPNAGVELKSDGVQKLRVDIDGTTVTGTIFVDNTSGEKVVLKDTNSTGNAVLNFIAFKDMNDLRQGVVGFGSSSNDDLIVQTDAGFGDVILNPQGVAALRASNTAVAISVPLTATSYDGILAANLLDKTAAEAVSGVWNFTADVGIGTANPARQLEVEKSTAGDVAIRIQNAAGSGQTTSTATLEFGVATSLISGKIVVGRVNDHTTGALIDSFMAFYTVSNNVAAERIRIDDIGNVGIGTVNPGAKLDVNGSLKATTYDGIAAVNLVDKTAPETISDVWDFTTNPKIDAAGIDTGTFADARIAESNVTQHQAALTIASSQLTGLQLTDNSDVVSAANTNRFALMANGTIGYVGRLLTEADISDLQAYLTSFTEVNDLTAAVTWANVPNANITQGSVTQHETALTILESQITDGAILAREGANASFVALTATSYGGITEANLLDKSAAETVSGAYTFSDIAIFSNATSSALDSSIFMAAVAPVLTFDQTDAAVNERLWATVVSGGTLLHRVVSDDALTAADWLLVDRTGIVVDTITLAGTSIVVSGALTATSYGGITEANLLDKSAAEVITGAREYQGNMGFYSTTPIAKQTGVAVTAAGVHAALVNLGLIAA